MNTDRLKFITHFATDVFNATKGTNLFPSVVMAQMILESSDSKGRAGQGITAVKANNFFGIKAQNGYTGQKMAFSTPKDGKPVNYFRVYTNPVDSIKDHSNFLIVNTRYKANGVFTATTPEMQAWALQRSGYAEGTDGHGAGYADKLIKLINDYKLKLLDDPTKTAEIAGGSLLGVLGLALGLLFILK